MEFKIGDKVRIIERDIMGYVDEINAIKVTNPETLEVKYIGEYKVHSGNNFYICYHDELESFKEKKQIKDLSEEQLENNINNPKVLELIGFVYLWQGKSVESICEVYEPICKLKELFEQEIEVEE